MSTVPLSPHSLKPTRPSLVRDYSWKTKCKHIFKRMVRAAEACAPMVLPIAPNRRVVGEVKIGDRVVRYYKHWPNDLKVLAAWDKLSTEVPGGMVFQSPLWQEGATIIPDAIGTLRLVTVHECDRLVAAIPLERRWGGHWETANEVSTAYHDPLIHPDGAEQTVDALLRGLTRFDRHFHSLTFQLFTPNSPWLDVIPRLAGAVGLKSEKTFVTTDTIVPFAPTWEKYLESLPGHDRRELRRLIRKLEESGKSKFVVNSTEQDVVERLPHTLQLMINDKGGKSRKTRWMFRDHLLKSAPALAKSGRFVLYELFIENQLAAGSIALTQNNQQWMFNGAFDPKFHQWAPGIVLWGMKFRHAISQGQTSMDLLRGLPPYKQALGAIERPMHKLTLTR